LGHVLLLSVADMISSGTWRSSSCETIEYDWSSIDLRGNIKQSFSSSSHGELHHTLIYLCFTAVPCAECKCKRKRPRDVRCHVYQADIDKWRSQSAWFVSQAAVDQNDKGPPVPAPCPLLHASCAAAASSKRSAAFPPMRLIITYTLLTQKDFCTPVPIVLGTCRSTPSRGWLWLNTMGD